MTGVLVKEEATGEQTYADSKGELVRFATGRSNRGGRSRRRSCPTVWASNYLREG